MQRVIEREVSLVRSDFESQRAMDQDTIAQTEHQMEQMSDTLKSLNGIFKAMQADGSAARTADLVSEPMKNSICVVLYTSLHSFIFKSSHYCPSV